MNLKIVYDNEAMNDFEAGWGFSALIETENEKILFDTGWDGNVLVSNLDRFGVKPEEIDKVVLSHAHWDHIGGLTHIMRSGMSVFLPRSFSDHLKEELSTRVDLHEIKESQEVTNRVWTTGELENEIEEQALALELEKGLIIIAGCSHPGVPKIISAASDIGKIYGIIGGLHDFEDYKVLEGLEFIAATHCTENKDKIRELYPESFVEVSAGSEIRLGR